MRGEETIRSFGTPLVFFTEAPENEDAGQDARKDEGKPSSLRDLCKRGGEVYAIEGREDDEDREDDEGAYTPDYEGDDGDHAGCDESDEDDADTVGVAEGGCLCGGGLVGCLDMRAWNVGSYIVVHCGHDYRTDHEEPVGKGDVDLPVEDLGGVHHLDLGKVRKLHDLREELFLSDSHSDPKELAVLTWNVDVIIACDATMAAKIAMTRLGYSMPGGAELKKGFEYAEGFTLMYAAWPTYASNKHGNAKHIQLSWIARMLKAPRSANIASTPVKASRIPPSDFQPSVPFRTR